jgi:hypothetical protein
VKWYKGNSRRVFKKHLPFICSDGVSRSFQNWEDALDEVSRLKPGDPIFNLYTKKTAKVERVTMTWRSLGTSSGQYIDDFIIITDDGYYLYDPPSDLEYYRTQPENA